MSVRTTVRKKKVKQMDQPLYLLLGAGVLIVIVALFIKKSGEQENHQTAVIHKQMERAEMEKALQRFVKQVKEENERLVDDFRQTKRELLQQIAHLEERMQRAEHEITEHAKLAKARLQQAALKKNEPTGETDAEEEDLLALHERYRRVFELKQEGLRIDEIAKRLGAGRGEIELILSLAAPNERGSSHG
jgi:DNA-binding NarL/FixJ family response regulator